jgi:ketosteroid isomerase-like protein
MSEENVEALKRVYAGWAHGDFRVEESLFDPYMVGVYPDPEPIPQYGLEAVREYMRQFRRTFDDMRFEATRFRAANGSVVVDVRRFGIGKQSGVTLEDKVFHVCTLRGGRIIRIDVFDREDQALEAAGLSE